MSPKQAPQRTCIGCRQSVDADDMVRLVADPEGRVVADLKGRLPGRGAWVHVQAGCLDKAQRSVGRALSGRGPAVTVDASNLRETVESVVHHALEAGLSQAAAGGGLAGGRSATDQALQDGRARFVLVASDAAERTARGVRQTVEAWDSEAMVLEVSLTSADLGRLTGKATRAVIAVLDVASSVHLRRQLRRLRSLG